VEHHLFAVALLPGKCEIFGCQFPEDGGVFLHGEPSACYVSVSAPPGCLLSFLKQTKRAGHL